MKGNLTSFVAGVVFAIGLGLAGLLDPARIIGFVDFFGVWDPSLAFAMGGAVVLTFFLFRIVLKRPHPLFDDRFHLPTKKKVTVPLVVGSAIFGVGWGIGGYCPGPAVTAAVLGNSRELVVLGAMIVGMVGVRLLRDKIPTG